MHVAIDITAAATQQAGIGRSVRELVRALVVERDRPDLTLVYTRRGPSRAADALAVHERVRVRRIPVSPRIALATWFKARLPLPAEALAGPVQVFHGPDFTLPPLVAAHGVLTVHDLSYVIRPQDAHPRQRRFLETAVPRSIDRARLVVAVSEATKRDLMQRYGVRPHRIRVVPNAVPEWFGPVTDCDELAAVRRQLGLPERFVLSVGTIQPRKNIGGLARAVSLASARAGSPTIEHVHAGGEAGSATACTQPLSRPATGFALWVAWMTTPCAHSIRWPPYTPTRATAKGLAFPSWKHSPAGVPS